MPDVSVIADADGEVTFVLQSGAYVYMGVNSHPARIVRTAMNTSVSHLPTQTVTLAMDEIYPNCAAIDEVEAVLFVGLLHTSPARLVMVK